MPRPILTPSQEREESRTRADSRLLPSVFRHPSAIEVRRPRRISDSAIASFVTKWYSQTNKCSQTVLVTWYYVACSRSSEIGSQDHRDFGKGGISDAADGRSLSPTVGCYPRLTKSRGILSRCIERTVSDAVPMVGYYLRLTVGITDCLNRGDFGCSESPKFYTESDCLF